MRTKYNVNVYRLLAFVVATAIFLAPANTSNAFEGGYGYTFGAKNVWPGSIDAWISWPQYALPGQHISAEIGLTWQYTPNDFNQYYFRTGWGDDCGIGQTCYQSPWMEYRDGPFWTYYSYTDKSHALIGGPYEFQILHIASHWFVAYWWHDGAYYPLGNSLYPATFDAYPFSETGYQTWNGAVLTDPINFDYAQWQSVATGNWYGLCPDWYEMWGGTYTIRQSACTAEILGYGFQYYTFKGVFTPLLRNAS